LTHDVGWAGNKITEIF